MSVMSDVMLQNFMPRSILESDDDQDNWSSASGGSSQCSDSGSYTSAKDLRDPSDFVLFQDYFGLSNLLNNIQVSEDNPLLHSTQKNLALLQRRRFSYGSDGSDSGVVLSPTLDSAPCSYDRGFDANMNNINMDPGMTLPPPRDAPPSMKLSKAMRDHIISGAYQQQMNNRRSSQDKLPPSPPNGLSSANISLPPPPQSVSPVLQPVHPAVVNHKPQTQIRNVNVPTQQPARPQSGLHVCVFCRNNGEDESVYTSHVLKDSDGRTSCPILRAYTCPICKLNGDSSHTIKYCPMNQNPRVPSSIGGVMGPQPPHPINLGQQRNSYQPQRPGGFRPPFPTNLAAHAGRMNHHVNHVNHVNHPPTVKLRQ